MMPRKATSRSAGNRDVMQLEDPNAAPVSPPPDAEVVALVQKILNELLKLVEAQRPEAALHLLVQLFETGKRYRSKISEDSKRNPLGIFLGPVGELCRGKNEDLVIRTSGDDPPRWWVQFNSAAHDINRAIKKQAIFTDLHGEAKPLSSMPLSEAAEIIERMLFLAAEGRTHLEAILSR